MTSKNVFPRCPRTIGKSSCHSMLISLVLLVSKCGGHLLWNHLPLKKPPNPIALAASVYSEGQGKRWPRNQGRKITYFIEREISSTFEYPWKIPCSIGYDESDFYPSGEVYYALKEGFTRDYYSASELQSTNKGLEI